MNVYGFVGNNPLMFVDPLGLDFWDFCNGALDSLKEPVAMASDALTLSMIGVNNLISDDTIYAEDMAFDSGTFSGLTQAVVDDVPVLELYGDITESAILNTFTLGQYSTQLASWQNYQNYHYGLIDDETYIKNDHEIKGQLFGGYVLGAGSGYSNPKVRARVNDSFKQMVDKGRDSIAKIKSLGNKECVAPDGKFYSTAFETKLDPVDFGRHNSVHFNRANAALDDALRSDAYYAALMEQLSPGIANRVSSVGGRQNPANFTWHHDASPGIMQLVPTEQHTPGSIFWRTLHPAPGAAGGYAIWAIPAGAPKR